MSKCMLNTCINTKTIRKIENEHMSCFYCLITTDYLLILVYPNNL